MKLETRADEIILLMESDLAGDYSDEISKGNWMRQHPPPPLSDNFKYKIFRGIAGERTQGRELKDGRRVIELIREMGLEL